MRIRIKHSTIWQAIKLFLYGLASIVVGSFIYTITGDRIITTVGTMITFLIFCFIGEHIEVVD